MLEHLLRQLLRVERCRPSPRPRVDGVVRELPAERVLKFCSRRHEVIAICIQDPFESYLPTVGLLRVQDQESGVVKVIDASLMRGSNGLSERISVLRAQMKARFSKAGIDFLELTHPEDDMLNLTRFFIERRGHQGFARARGARLA